MPRSCIANIGTQAKASLTSNRSTSLIDQPVLASSLLIAPTGATVKSFGSCACAACATSFATGFAPLASATDWRVSTTSTEESRVGYGGVTNGRTQGAQRHLAKQRTS